MSTIPRHLDHSPDSPLSMADCPTPPRGLDAPGRIFAEIDLRITRQDLWTDVTRLSTSHHPRPSPKNGIESALRRQVKSSLPVSISFEGNSVFAQVDDWKFDLGPAVLSWLAEVLLDHDTSPGTFRVTLPVEYLRPATAAASGTRIV